MVARLLPPLDADAAPHLLTSAAAFALAAAVMLARFTFFIAIILAAAALSLRLAWNLRRLPMSIAVSGALPWIHGCSSTCLAVKLPAGARGGEARGAERSADRQGTWAQARASGATRRAGAAFWRVPGALGAALGACGAPGFSRSERGGGAAPTVPSGRWAIRSNQEQSDAISGTHRAFGSMVRHFWTSSLAPGVILSHHGEGKSYRALRI